MPLLDFHLHDDSRALKLLPPYRPPLPRTLPFPSVMSHVLCQHEAHYFTWISKEWLYPRLHRYLARPAGGRASRCGDESRDDGCEVYGSTFFALRCLCGWCLGVAVRGVSSGFFEGFRILVFGALRNGGEGHAAATHLADLRLFVDGARLLHVLRQQVVALRGCTGMQLPRISLCCCLWRVMLYAVCCCKSCSNDALHAGMSRRPGSIGMRRRQMRQKHGVCA